MGGKLSGRRIAMIVANRYEDIELLFPILRLSEEGAEITVSAVGNDVKGMFGHPVPIPVMRDGNRYRTVPIEAIKAEEIDCLYFPGGYGPDILRLHEGTLQLVRDCHRLGKFIAAICHGPWVLINAGAEFIDVPAVRDGNIITGRVPDDLPEFCQEIIKALTEGVG
jgi:protease I